MPTYTPNRRLIPSGFANRNILTEGLFGVIEGMTKVSLSGKIDCIFEGPELIHSWVQLLYRYLFEQNQAWRQETQINIVPQTLFVEAFDIATRCNYFATLQAMIVNKFIIDALYMVDD